MAAGPNISIEFDKGWAVMLKALTSERFRRILRKHVALATHSNGLIAAKAIRKEIKNNVPPKNVALTSAIKGSTKALVDKGQLFQSITVDRHSWDQSFVGVKYMNGAYNVAEALHNGAVIPVSQKMRAMFFYLWLASMHANGMRSGRPPVLTGRAAQLFERYKDWKPLKDSTRVIKIPPRPFIKMAFQRTELRALIQQRWQDAVDRAYKEAAGK